MRHSRLNHFLCLSGAIVTATSLYCFTPSSNDAAKQEKVEQPSKAEMIVATPIRSTRLLDQVDVASVEKLAAVVFDDDSNAFQGTQTGPRFQEPAPIIVDDPAVVPQELPAENADAARFLSPPSKQVFSQPKPATVTPSAKPNQGVSTWKSNPYLNRQPATKAKPNTKANSTTASSGYNWAESFDEAESESVRRPTSQDGPSEVETVNLETANSAAGNLDVENLESINLESGSFGPSAQATRPTAQPRSVYEGDGQANLPIGSIAPTRFSIPDSVNIKAAHHIEYGKSLARRGATFAARQEFFAGLRLVAQAIDAQTGDIQYTRALSDAVVALKEATDFYITDSENQLALSVEKVIDGHQTKILDPTTASRMTPVQAMQAYLAYAQSELISSGGQTVVAAEAMYCLGKMHSVSSSSNQGVDPLDMAKSIVYHRASLECNPKNFRSANELGVLMARNGQLDQAKELLKQSLRIKPMPNAWKSLAVIHQRMGERQLSNLATEEFIASSQQIPMGLTGTIQWYSPNEFNASAPVELHDNVARKLEPTKMARNPLPAATPAMQPAQPTRQAQPGQQQPERSANRSIFDRIRNR